MHRHLQRRPVAQCDRLADLHPVITRVGDETEDPPGLAIVFDVRVAGWSGEIDRRRVFGAQQQGSVAAADLEFERRLVDVLLVAAHRRQSCCQVAEMRLVVAHQRQQEPGGLRQVPIHQLLGLMLRLPIAHRRGQRQAAQRSEADGAQQAPAQRLQANTLQRTGHQAGSPSW
ncbi:MAG: hypothetical protein AW08_03550 [Candidatus Accumulibacter adjunctus]|uniref:Uncharacterized protein n=1 Tax=Candidatus Accumulibacter adjunctus TaxID=1454001 RepID=A0A011PFJ6_9PROT|nr:MAG: hypothetical protein AW08_03550 [Candidatus Accumulibacter adjunctus]